MGNAAIAEELAGDADADLDEFYRLDASESGPEDEDEEDDEEEDDDDEGVQPEGMPHG